MSFEYACSCAACGVVLVRGQASRGWGPGFDGILVSRVVTRPSLASAVCPVQSLSQVSGFIPRLSPTPSHIKAGTRLAGGYRQVPQWLLASTQEKGPSSKGSSRQSSGEELGKGAIGELGWEDALVNSTRASGGKASEIGLARALASPSESKAAELREAKRAKEQSDGAKSQGRLRFPNPIEIPIKAGRAARRALEALGKVEEVSERLRGRGGWGVCADTPYVNERALTQS